MLKSWHLGHIVIASDEMSISLPLHVSKCDMFDVPGFKDINALSERSLVYNVDNTRCSPLIFIL